MSWLSTAIAKGAVIALHLDETSGTTAADSSGNGHHFTYPGSQGFGHPPLVVDGGYSIYRTVNDQNPLAFTDTGIPAGLNGYAGEYVVMESWVNISAGNHHGYFIKTGRSNNGLGVGIGTTQNDADGRKLCMGASGYQWIPTSYTFTTDGAYHVVVWMKANASGGNDLKWYINGVQEGSGTYIMNTAMDNLAVGGTFWPDALAYLDAGVDLDACAFYATNLSDTDIADLYAAGTGAGSPPITISGEEFTATVTMLDGTPVVTSGPITISGEEFSITVAMLDGVAVTSGGPIAISGEAFTAIVTLLDGTAVLGGTSITVAGQAFTATVTMLNGLPPLVTVAGQAFSATITMVDGYIVGALPGIVLDGEAFDVPIIWRTGLAGRAPLPGTTQVDPADPDPQLLAGVGTGRWMFTDPDTSDSYLFEINPNQMDTPHPLLNLTPGARSATTGSQNVKDVGVPRVIQGKRTPLTWTFSGVSRTRTQYLALRRWSVKKRPILVTDHFGRTWSILLTGVKFEERRPNPTVTWRFHYTATCTMYGRVG